MRYDKTICFVSVEKTYDETTGDYSSAIVDRVPVNASVMDTRTETLKLIYGDIRQGSLTIHVQNHYPDSFNYIEYNDKRYRVDFRRSLRFKDTFIVSEVQ